MHSLVGDFLQGFETHDGNAAAVLYKDRIPLAQTK